MSRLDLDGVMRHCREVGVNLAFECRCDDLTGFGDADLIVAADGANSAIRTRYSERFTPTLDERPNLLAWYGTTRLFEPLSLIFRQNQDGLIIAHCYQYSGTHSTFLVDSSRHLSEAGLVDVRSKPRLCAAFADDLQGTALIEPEHLVPKCASSRTPG